MRSMNVAKLTSRVCTRSVSYGFCVGFAQLDPRKHITMNHQHHNMYLDSYEYGEYPDWVHIGSIAPRTYEQQVISILASSLSEKLVVFLI